VLSSICVETSLREGFNTGYDVAIISDATASGDKRHYETTLERVRCQDYKIKYGVQAFEQFVDVFLKEVLEKVNTALRIQINSIEL